MDNAEAAALRAEWYAKVQRAYGEALHKNPAAGRILTQLEETSDADELASLLAETIDVGYQMRRVDDESAWPVDLDVGSVYRRWQQDWGMEAVYALGRAIGKRDGLGFEDPEFYRLTNSRLREFAGDEALLEGKPNFLHYLGEAEPEQAPAFFQSILGT